LFPKAPDQHKPGNPLVPNGLGVLYVLASTVYLFLLYYFDFKEALTLASCILFGGFMGLLDDWMDMRWRYKAFLPIFAALPLAVLREGTPEMATYLWGKINFRAINFFGVPGEIIFYFIIIPLVVTVTTNAVNQLGGLNGLETLCPSIALTALLIASKPRFHILLYVPLLTYVALAVFNFQGKIFVGNTGSFAIGITLASYAIVANIEQALLISILPYVFNSSLILLNFLFFKRRAKLILDGNKLRSTHRRSLVTLITYYRPSTERQTVLIISLIIALFGLLAVLVNQL